MTRRAYVVTDIGYGDAGKGTTVDYLVRQAQSAVVVRHNGGAQAAHNVVTPDRQHHTFAQFGSGSFVPGVLTHLSRYMLVNPLNMLYEAEHLQALGLSDIWERTSVDQEALIITPWQQSANRLRELARGSGQHGTCGQGIGETQSDALKNPQLAIRVKDLLCPQNLRRKLGLLRTAKYDQLREEVGILSGETAIREWNIFTDQVVFDQVCEVFRDWVALVRVVESDYLSRVAHQHELLVFEGAQGVLLDERFGFHPHTTWSKTTHVNALQLLSELDYDGPVTRLGVMRAYTTRHGNGPLVTEDQDLTHALPDFHNNGSGWQGMFRVGHLDLLAHRYALAACGETDALVVTGLDRLAELNEWKYCTEYRLDDVPPFADELFHFEGNAISGIELGIAGDRPRQTQLTELLFSCKPVYQSMSALIDMPDKQDLFLRTIEGDLGLPIALVSNGPSAADKRALIAY